MVAPNSSFDTNSPFTVLSGPAGMPVRRVSNASIDKLAAQARKRVVKKGTRAKAVRFSDSTKVIARKANIAAEAWYQPKDYAVIKHDLLGSIHAISQVFQGAALDLSEHCLRGIETSISADLHQRRKTRIQTTTQSVLEQQRQQRLKGVSDPQALRAISERCTQEAQESALSVGKLDSQL